jgi:hypothetical protein
VGEREEKSKREGRREKKKKEKARFQNGGSWQRSEKLG